MNTKLIYGTKLVELRKKYLDKNEPLAKSYFFIFENFEENALLFIGINPSEVKGLNNKYSVIYGNGI